MNTDEQYSKALEVARKLGAEDGYGRTHPCDLSGEYGPGGPAVYEYILSQAGVEEPEEEDWFTDILDAYEEAYEDARAESVRAFMYGVYQYAHKNPRQAALADAVTSFLRKLLEGEE
jgi:hypothetical protein